MTGIDMHPVDAPQGGRVDGMRTTATLAAATDALYLAATPTFAIMALLTGLSGGNADVMCSAAHGTLLGGMVPMYVLMSAFHSAPWLTRIWQVTLRRLP